MRVHDPERLDIRDNRRHGQPPAMRVRGERAAERQVVRASLLLCDAPARLHARSGCPLHRQIAIDQRWPRDARLCGHEAAAVFHGQHAPHPAHVDESAARGKLLATHRVTCAAHADRLTGRRGATHDALHIRCGARPLDPGHFRRIQRRMHVVDEHAVRLSAGAPGPGRCHCDTLDSNGTPHGRARSGCRGPAQGLQGEGGAGGHQPHHCARGDGRHCGRLRLRQDGPAQAHHGALHPRPRARARG